MEASTFLGIRPIAACGCLPSRCAFICTQVPTTRLDRLGSYLGTIASSYLDGCVQWMAGAVFLTLGTYSCT